MSKDWVADFKQKGNIPNFDLSHQPELRRFYYDFPPNATQQPKASKVGMAIALSVVAGGVVYALGQWVNSIYLRFLKIKIN